MSNTEKPVSPLHAQLCRLYNSKCLSEMARLLNAVPLASQLSGLLECLDSIKAALPATLVVQEGKVCPVLMYDLSGGNYYCSEERSIYAHIPERYFDPAYVLTMIPLVSVIKEFRNPESFLKDLALWAEKPRTEKVSRIPGWYIFRYRAEALTPKTASKKDRCIERTIAIPSMADADAFIKLKKVIADAPERFFQDFQMAINGHWQSLRFTYGHEGETWNQLDQTLLKNIKFFLPKPVAK